MGCAAIALLAPANTCFGLDPTRPVNQYAREIWGLRSGLPQGRITSITQSPDGYLWVGTEQGPRRFDGLSFTSIPQTSQAPILLEHVLGLVSDRQGNIWLRLQSPTLVQYRDATFAAVDLDPERDSLVTAMARTQDGSILFASRLDGVFRSKGSRFDTLLPKASLPPSPVISIAATPDGDVWLGTLDAGLFRLHDRLLTRIREASREFPINCLLNGTGTELYVGTNRGLALWDGSRFTQAGLPKAVLDTPILTMVRDHDANIWLGTRKGLLRMNARGVSLFGETGSEKAITALFEDREGDIWAGSVDELDRIQESAFNSAREILAQQPGGPIHAGSNGRIWGASSLGGLYSLDDGAHDAFQVPGLDRDEVYSIAGTDGDLWLGRKRKGLTHVTFRDGVSTSRSYTQADGLPQNSVFAVHQNRDGSIWTGTLAGASYFQKGRFTNYTTASGLASNAIRSIAEDADHTMWFATSAGLSRFAENRWTSYGTPEGLPSDNVNTLFEDSANVLWVGTVRGIACVRAGKVLVPPTLPPPLLEQIFGIAEDHLGSLWITTSQGILRVDRTKLMNGDISSRDVREFGPTDGITGSTGVRRERSLCVDSTGRVWLSTTSGIGSIDPARLRQIAVPTMVHIDRIVVDGEPRDVPGSTLLPPNPKRVVIEYAGLNLAAPDQVRFRFKLDGFDSQWGPEVTRKEAIYTNLGPGDYQFHLMASDADHVWGEIGAGISFRIAPTLWQAWWFRSAAGLAFALSLPALYRLRLRQVTEQVNTRFEAQLAERTRIARELHDTLLQSFHGLMLRFQAVDNMLPDKPSRAKESLSIAINHAERAITEGRDAVQQLRSTDLAKNDLLETLTALGHELAASEPGKPGPTFRVLIEGTPRQLHPSMKEDLYRISREALVNAFRHAQATHIELDIRYDPRTLRLRVRDDGVGIDPDILDSGRRGGHWGLPGMQERASAMQGHLEIWSDLTRGTEIELKVPGSIAYAEVKAKLWKL